MKENPAGCVKGDAVYYQYRCHCDSDKYNR